MTLCGDGLLLLQDKIGCAAELSFKCTSDNLSNLGWDAVMEQNSGLPQTELLLSFLPQVLLLKWQRGSSI